MTVTLTATYRDILAPETVAEIDDLLQNDFDLGPMLEFIDEHNEADFREYYSYYVEAGENHGYEAVDCFLKEVGPASDLEIFDSIYLGEYDSPDRMAEDFLEDEINRLSCFIVIDWESTADYLLNHEVDRYGDFYFRTCY